MGDPILEQIKELLREIIQHRASISDANKEEPAMARAKTAEEKAVLDALANAAGKVFQETDIAFEGTRLVIPARWTTKKAISVISQYQAAQEEFHEFSDTFPYRPWDGAAATERALRTLTGGAGIGKATMSFWGPQPPQRVSINVGVNEKISVPWGNISVPLFDDGSDEGTPYLQLGSVRHAEYGVLFHISAFVAKKYEPQIQGLFALIREELEQRSIYKGKAFTAADEPEFLDLSKVDPAKVIYSDDVMQQLNAHLFGIIKYADEMRAHDISLKRSVLFYGPYGTGKTLGGILTAQEAVANGWTFVTARPGKDDPFIAMQTARLYAPAVVFIEDIDTLSRSEGMNHDNLSKLLDQFDGLEAKGAEVLNVMTTNHQDSITRGMLRPGRLDALIEISNLDRGGVQRMVESLVPADMLDSVDYDRVFDACEGYLPAFVAESVTRAKNASIVRGEGVLLPLNTADLINGASTLRPQFEMMQRATEVDVPATFDAAFRSAVRDSVNDIAVSLNDGNIEGVLLNQ